MLRSKVTALSAAALLGGVLGACGGDGVDPQTYAREVCGSIQDWFQSMQSGMTDVQEVVAGEPAEAKEGISNFLDDAVDSTGTLIGELEDTGVPAVDDGEEVHDTLIEGLEKARSTFEDAAQEAEDLPTDSRESFQAAAQELGASMSQAQSEIEETFGGVEPPEELNRAFEEENSCEDVQLDFGG